MVTQIAQSSMRTSFTTVSSQINELLRSSSSSSSSSRSFHWQRCVGTKRTATTSSSSSSTFKQENMRDDDDNNNNTTNNNGYINKRKHGSTRGRLRSQFMASSGPSSATSANGNSQRHSNEKSNAFEEFVDELSSTYVRTQSALLGQEQEQENKKTTTKTMRRPSRFEVSGGFLYAKNFFKEDDFENMQKHCDDLRKHLREEKRVCANSRLGVMVPVDNFIHKIINSDYCANRLRDLVLSPDDLERSKLQPSDVPVEYRIYPFGGSMDWHRDVALYTEPQFEIVCTIKNSSDSRTEWKDPITGRRRGIRSEPNSVLIVQADSVVHRVTPITKGERSIVKFAYSTTAEKTQDYYDNLSTYDDVDDDTNSNSNSSSNSNR